jgi:mitochondrial FAD-linked sulfhydryl oxidase
MAIDDYERLKKALPSKGFSNIKNILDDCDRPACEDTASALSAALKHSANTVKTTTTACPPTKNALGSSSWDLLHSMAAWYPDNPTPTDETMIQQFYTCFARFYPCTWCAEDFQKNLQEKPVQSSTRKDLCIWLCEQHNIVNQKIGKPAFQCDIQTLDERWRKSSDPKCQSKLEDLKTQALQTK